MGCPTESSSPLGRRSVTIRIRTSTPKTSPRLKHGTDPGVHGELCANDHEEFYEGFRAVRRRLISCSDREHCPGQIDYEIRQAHRIAGRAHVGNHGAGSRLGIASLKSLNDLAVLLER